MTAPLVAPDPATLACAECGDRPAAHVFRRRRTWVGACDSCQLRCFPPELPDCWAHR